MGPEPPGTKMSPLTPPPAGTGAGGGPAPALAFRNEWAAATGNPESKGLPERKGCRAPLGLLFPGPENHWGAARLMVSPPILRPVSAIPEPGPTGLAAGIGFLDMKGCTAGSSPPLSSNEGPSFRSKSIVLLFGGCGRGCDCSCVVLLLLRADDPSPSTAPRKSTDNGIQFSSLSSIRFKSKSKVGRKPPCPLAVGACP